MRIRYAAARAAALLGCGLVLGGGAFALAQSPGGDVGSSVAVPAGTISAYAGTDAPSGWLIADGSAVSRFAYPALYSAIGDRYGAGNGTTTFNLPDLRGRITVGQGEHASVRQVGLNDGTPLAQRTVKHRHGKGSLAVGSIPHGGGHSHGIPVFGNDTGRAHYDWYGAEGTDGWYGMGTYWTGGGEHGHSAPGLSGQVGDATGPAEGPAFMTVNYIIKG